MIKLKLVLPAIAVIPLALGLLAMSNGCGGAGTGEDDDGGGGGGSVTVTVSPKTASIATSAAQQFSAVVSGSANTNVTWTVVEAGGGTISAGGLYTAPGSAGTYHVRATSQAAPTASDTATVTVTSGGSVTVTVSPKTASIAVSTTQQFSAVVTGSANTNVTWTVDEAGGGTISAGGLYTAPASAGTYHVRATSQAAPAVSDTATVTVTGGGSVTVTVSPKTKSLAPSGTQQFSAVVTGSANTNVTWSVDEAGGGTVTAGGLYTAPAAVGTYHVRATSQAAPAVSDFATVTVAAAGASLQFSIDATINEIGTSKATTLTTVELLDTTGALVKTATIAAGTASIDMGGLTAGFYFIRVNGLADDLVPTKIDNPAASFTQTVGRKLRITKIGPAGNPTYRAQTFSKGQAIKNIVKYSDGTNATPTTYDFGFLYLKTTPMVIENRVMGTAALLSSYSNSSPHPFATWALDGGSSKPHGDPSNYSSDAACSCHGNLDNKQTTYGSIRAGSGWCYKCHYGKTGYTNGFVNPGK